VKRNQPYAILHCNMQGGNVAEANEHLGMTVDDVEVDLLQEPGRTVAAPGTPHGRGFRVGERGHEFSSAGRIVAGEVAELAVDVAVRLRAKARFLQAFHGAFDAGLIQGAGRRHDANRAAALQRVGLHGIHG
jgi:hypothetical protein